MILSSVSAVNDFNPNLSCINSKLCYEINTFRLIVNIFIKKIYIIYPSISSSSLTSMRLRISRLPAP